MPATNAKRLFVVPPEEPEPLMTPVQVANWLGITVDALRMKARRGEITAIRLDGRNMRFKRSAVQTYIDTRPEVQ
jgi:excisionase family DNA binding protein